MPFYEKLEMKKKCEAPKSNRIVAGTELMENVANTTSGASWASSAVTWLMCPFLKAGMDVYGVWAGPRIATGVIGALAGGGDQIDPSQVRYF